MIAFLLFAAVVSAWGKPAEIHDPMINEDLFEGDIKGIDPTQDRNAVARDSQRWPQGIVPYYIDSSLNHDQRDEILRAMRHIEESTCIKFVKRSPQHRHFLRIFRGSGCWSYWGFQESGHQDVSLGVGCGFFGTIVHELLHSLGFEHEHNRSDRDDYLIIHWQNIIKQLYPAFNKLRPDQNRLLTPFDFNSIMLYGHHFGNKAGLKSMESRTGEFMPQVYEKKGMSPSDIKRVNMLYNC